MRGRALAFIARLLVALLAAAAVIVSRPEALHAQSSAPRSAEPLGLSDVLRLAKQRAPAVRVALAQVASADAGIDRAAANWWPQLHAQGVGTASTSNGQNVINGALSQAQSERYLSGQASLNLQWTLIDFGRVSSQVSGAREGLNAARLSQRATEDAAMAEAAVAFFTILADDDVASLFQAASANRERIVTLTQQLVKEGYRSATDERRAQLALDAAKLDLTLAQATRDSDQIALRSALLLDAWSPVQFGAASLPEVGATGIQDPAPAIARRRDVAAAKARLGQAREEADAAASARWPVVSTNALARVGYLRDTASYAGNGGAFTRIAGVSTDAQVSVVLTVPLLDAATGANIRSAEAAVAERSAELQQLKSSASREVLQSSFQVQSAQAVLEQARKVARGAAANIAVIETRYAAGLESPLVLADAQHEDMSAKLGVVRARLANQIATVRLLAATGRVRELLDRL